MVETFRSGFPKLWCKCAADISSMTTIAMQLLLHVQILAVSCHHCSNGTVAALA